MKKGKISMRAISALLAILMIVSVLPFAAFAVGVDANVMPPDTYLISQTQYNIAPGIEETQFITNNAAGTQQDMGYAVTIAMDSNSSIIAGYKDMDGSTPGLQTVRDQAKIAERKRGVNVVAGVNGMIFNMANGATSGLLVMNGVKYNDTQGYPYFAVLKDGTAVIREANVPTDDVQEAIGLWQICLRDGVNLLPVSGGSYADDGNPRTAIGIKEDGSVVMMVVDGRQSPKACGMSWYEVMEIMRGMGCVIGGHLDGGGSSTYVSKHEGESVLSVTNSPSDGVERAVSTSLFVVSSATPSGEFDHAALTPNNEVYTPGSSVAFSAKGVDSAGAAAPLPEDGSFALADGSFGSITPEGVFDSNGKIGTVTVNYISDEKVCGSVSIEIQDPDEIYFASDEVSLGFEAETDFGLTMKYQGKPVNFKAGDVVWSAVKAGTDEDCLAQIGTFDGNILTTADGLTITADVTATYVSDSELNCTIKAIIGMLPTIVWDFEDSDYFTINGENSNFKTGTANRGEISTAEIVSIYDDYPVRFGTQSLKLGYDFTPMTTVATAGSYFGMTETVEIPGMPTGIGVWVYAPEGTPNFWLRGYIYANHNHSAVTPVDFTLQTSQATAETPAGIYWSGWKYCEADLTQIQGPYELAKGFTFRLMYVPGINMGTKSAGEIYLDNLQFVYGANIDDVDEPVIDSMMVNETEIESGATVVDSNTVTIKTYYHDVQNKYTTGIEVVRMYIDGKEVTGSDEYFESFNDGIANLYEVELANGWHSLKLTVRDGFGNEKTESRYFKVEGEKDYPTIGFVPVAENPILGTNYDIEINTNYPEDLTAATVKIAAGTGFNNYAFAFEPAWANSTYTYNAKANTITLNLVKTEGAEVTEKIATLSYAIPDNLFEGTVFTCDAQALFNSSVDVPDAFLPVSSSGAIAKTVMAKYSVSCEPVILDQQATIYVFDSEGNAASDVAVYTVDGSLVGTSDENGVVVSDEISKQIGLVNIYAEKDGLRSFAYGVSVVSVPADLSDALPQHIMSNATANGSSQKNITWLSNPLLTADNAVVMLAETEAYEKDGEAAFSAVYGESVILNLATTKNAVRSNHVALSDLKTNVEYSYKVGDGENWSAVYTFTLESLNKNTSFFVVGDIQAEDLSSTQSLLQSLVAADKYDFSIQTGDSVDNAGSYTYWTELLGIYNTDSLGAIDTIHVLGNHEHEGNLDGSNAAAIYGLESGTHGSCYSVQYGNVYVAVINYTANEAQLKDALAWLVEDAQASDATWKVLAMHQPAYYTNPTGGNGYINRLVPAAADEAGIDFVFSGHDHSYARTLPMTGGEVTEDGVVYFISGSTGEKAYDIVKNDSFNFACLDDSFDVAYLTIDTTDSTFTVSAHSRSVDGSSDILIDSYTKTKPVTCTESGMHDWNYKDGHLICTVCGYITSVGTYTGLINEADTGKTIYLYLGKVRTNGWLSMGDDIYYLDENGYFVTGKYTVTESVQTARPDAVSDMLFNGEVVSLEYTFDNEGKLIRGAVVNKNEAKYYVYAGVIQTGFYYIDGAWYFFDGVKNESRYGKALTGVWERNYTKYECDAQGRLIKGFAYEDVGGIKYFWAGEYLTGWQNVDGWFFNSSRTLKGRYYFNPEDGYMVTNATVVIDGETHTFDANGKCHCEICEPNTSSNFIQRILNFFRSILEFFTKLFK